MLIPCSRMDKQHRTTEEIDHAYTVHEAPDSRMRSHEERVPALEEAVHQKQETHAHGGGPGVSIGVCVVLREALRSRKHTRTHALLKNTKGAGMMSPLNWSHARTACDFGGLLPIEMVLTKHCYDNLKYPRNVYTCVAFGLYS